MITFNLVLMIVTSALLLVMLIRTRCYDSIGWWAFRMLSCYSLVCFVYLAYDTNIAGNELELKYLFVRVGFFTLVAAMVLSWRLIAADNDSKRKHDFNMRLKDIFRLGE
jgi:hypothetical protein